jgi:hypothetical protein
VPPHLTSHHRRTVERIFAHPTSANIEWRQIDSLLTAIGSDPELVAAPHHGKDASVETVLELRGVLTRAGLAPPLTD